MYLQRTQPTNPYAAYQTMLQQRGLLGARGMALKAPELQLRDLSAPYLRTQFFAHAARYERLGSHLEAVTSTLFELATPASAPAARIIVRPQASTGQVARVAASPATLLGGLPISLVPGTPESTATLTSEAPRLRLDTATPATTATLTLGPVKLNDTQMTRAVLRGDNLMLKSHATAVDFGALTINGVTTTIGVFGGGDERQAAQFIADRLNADQNAAVTAQVDTNSKRVTLTSKVPGSAGGIVVEGVTPDSDGIAGNEASTGFQAGDRADGRDGGSSDFGSVTINGVTTTFGALDNTQQTAQSAARWLVDALNANQANDFTAQVGGDALDRIVLTSRQAGSQGLIRIDQVTPDSDGNTQNPGETGLVAGLSAQGQDADPGTTDLGSLTLDGVTTTFGVLANAGLTPQAAARYMVERLNANADNPVVASLGGSDLDRVVLTAKTAGSAGSFRIDAVGSDTDGNANDGFNGWVAGREATGQDATSATTDFGSITLNGVTTDFGVLDSGQYTTRSALSYLIDRLNQTNPTVLASEQDGRLLLRSRDTGSAATLRIDAISTDSDGDPSNGQGLGFSVGQGARGKPEQVSQAPVAPKPAGSTRPALDPAQMGRVLGRTRDLVEGLNGYLEDLERERPNLPRSVQGFGREIARTLEKEGATLAGLGLSFKDHRVQLDEEAVQRDPQEVAALFGRLQQALDPLAGAQGHALHEMQAVSRSTAEQASTISQVAADIYRIQHRAKKIGWILEELQLAQDRMRDQQERLEKAARSKPDQEESEEGSRTDASSEAPTEEDAAGFGLLRSPVPESYLRRLEATPGSEPRWPFER